MRSLTAANVAWVEVRAKDVLDVHNTHRGGGRVRVVDCAVMQCDTCVRKHEARCVLEQERRVLQHVETMRNDRFIAQQARDRQEQAARLLLENGSASLAEKVAAGSESTKIAVPFWNEVIATTAHVLGIDVHSQLTCSGKLIWHRVSSRKRRCSRRRSICLKNCILDSTVETLLLSSSAKKRRSRTCGVSLGTLGTRKMAPTVLSFASLPGLLLWPLFQNRRN